MAEIDDIFRALHDQMQQLDDPEGAVVEATLSQALNGRQDMSTPSEWHPIETAPKDGTVILLYRYMEPWMVRGYGHWCDAGGGVHGWITNGFFDPPGNLGLAHPSHWMPIPKAPLP